MPNPLSRFLHYLLGSSRPCPRLAAEQIADLPTLKNSWKLMLGAHGRFLHLVHDSRTALQGKTFITMVFVRTQCTAMCVNVFAVLRHLREMTECAHADLADTFQTLRKHIDNLVAGQAPAPIQDLTLPLSSVDKSMSLSVGTKMAYLGEIRKCFRDLSVPDGFVITSAAYNLFLDHNGLRDEINRRLQTQVIRNTADMFRLSSELQLLIINSPLPEKLQESIHAAYRELEARAGHRGVRVAIRSSAVGEDTKETSFAGQYRTELNVSEELLFMAYKEVLASKYSLTAMNYRLSRGLKDEDLSMCVGCMIMVNTASAGVMYTQDPTSAESEMIFINAVHGLAKAISDGYVTPDLWKIARDPDPRITDRTIRSKEQKFVSFLSEEGVTLLSTPPAQRLQPSLTDDQVLRLSRIGLLLEDHFGSPLDIEWAVTKSGEMSILQSRPLKRVHARPDATDVVQQQTRPLLAGEQMASPGRATGKVFVVKTSNDLLHFPEGAVLVTPRPHPRWSALLPRAVAIVSESGGGIFGHLANIAREFGIPAVFDVKDACTILAADAWVTVDADQRIILPADKPEKDTGRPARHSLRNTPVYATLAEVMRAVDPPSAANPLDPRIMPERIKTLSDVAQLSHLLACRELLKLAQVPEFLSPLAVNHPANWWVLDLNDQRLGSPVDSGATRRQPVPFTSHPLLEGIWQGISRQRWTLFANSPRRSRLLRSLRRLRAAVRPLSPPRPRLFILSEDTALLFLSLERAFFLMHAHAGEHAEENSTGLLWQWFGKQAPPPSWLEQLTALLHKQGFEADIATDGLLAWSAGRSCETTVKQARFLGYFMGLVQQFHAAPKLPRDFDMQPSSDTAA
jgi:pyruvate, water dikinase